MGNIESKVAFKTRFASLWTASDIDRDDSVWAALFEPTSSVHEVFSIVSPDDVRRIRDSHPENFETLLYAVTDRLSQLARSAAIGSGVEPQLRGCLRIIARVFPFVYERPIDRTRQQWASSFVWNTSSPLIGPRLIDALAGMLLTRGFTVPITGSELIWATGLGRRTAPEESFSGSSKFNENRIEVLRALLAVLSEPLYTPSASGLDYWASSSPTAHRAEALWSLINFALAYEPKIWNRPFEDALLPDLNGHLAELCIETALLVITHAPAPPLKNRFRRLLAKVNADEDLWFLAGRLSEQLVERGSDTKLPIVALLWEAIQSNPDFKALVTKAVAPVLNDALADIVMLTASSTTSSPADVDASRIASYVLLTLTADPEYAKQTGSALFRKFIANNTSNSLEPSLADVIWNVSPNLNLGPREADEFAEFISRLPVPGDSSDQGNNQDVESDRQDNGEIREALAACARVIIDHYPTNNHTQPALEKRQVKFPAFPVTWQPLKFIWNRERFRWYVGVIWGCAYRTEQWNPKRSGPGSGVGLWANTKIELFKVETTNPPQVTFRRPQGAVDAAADATIGLVKGIVNRFWT